MAVAAGRIIRIRMVHRSTCTNPELDLQAMHEGEGSLLKHDQELQMMAGRRSRQGSAWFEFTTLRAASAEDGQSDEEEEAGSKKRKKRLIPEAVRSAIETVKRVMQVHPCVPHCPFCVPYCFIPQKSGGPKLDVKGELQCFPCSSYRSTLW